MASSHKDMKSMIFQIAEKVTISGHLDSMEVKSDVDPNYSRGDEEYFLTCNNQKIEKSELANCQSYCKIGVGASGKGGFVMSDSFGPCQAVVAKLTDGNFALYHASSCFSCPRLELFTSLLRSEGVEEVWIIEKSVHKRKALALAHTLSTELNVPINRLYVENYTAVFCDSVNNSVTFIKSNANYQIKENEKEEKQVQMEVEKPDVLKLAFTDSNPMSTQVPKNGTVVSIQPGNEKENQATLDKSSSATLSRLKST